MRINPGISHIVQDIFQTIYQAPNILKSHSSAMEIFELVTQLISMYEVTLPVFMEIKSYVGYSVFI